MTIDSSKNFQCCSSVIVYIPVRAYFLVYRALIRLASLSCEFSSKIYFTIVMGLQPYVQEASYI